jgi:uncharacterized protein YceH (UPF0502 family)
VSACNQTSNRDPVLSLDETTVMSAIDDLTRRSLVRAVHRSDARVKRYRQVLSESMNLHQNETAVVCVLLLRGPQTVGEIRGRTNRHFDFVDLAHVEITLRSLMDLPAPLVTELPRQPGQKESRYAHLLSGEPVEESTGSGDGATRAGGTGELMATSHAEDVAIGAGGGGGIIGRTSGNTRAGGAFADRIDELEQTVDALRGEVAELRARLEALLSELS